MPAVLDRAELEASPLADLHAIADQLGLDGFRRLRKGELIDRIVGENSEGSGEESSAESQSGDDESSTRSRPRRRGIGPTRKRLGHVRDHRLVISRSRQRTPIRIQLGEAEREQLHQLARIILIRCSVLRRIGLDVISHVQITPHGRA